MNDPHVDSLVYRLEVGASLSFANPPARELETNTFKMRLDDAILTISMKEHYPSVDLARSHVERVVPFLRSWELDNALRYGPDAFRFIFVNAKVVDRDPPPPGSAQTICPASGGGAVAGGAAGVCLGLAEYPTPPSDFIVSPDVETLWYRYRMHREGKESLSAMAYFCLTLLLWRAGGPGTGRAGGRGKAATTFGIDKPVLDKLSYLVSGKGDEKTIRKFPPAGKPLHLQPHTPQEESWINDVVKALIRRVGEHAAGASPLKKLTMANFPQL
jgi:hypothetical protein